MFKNISTDEHIPQIRGDIEGEMRNVKENIDINRLETPVKLNPDTATEEDVFFHAKNIQRRKPRQIKKLLTYRHFMENHIIPVDFTDFENTNDSYEKVFKHLNYREVVEFDNCKNKRGTGALRNQWASIKMHLDAYKIPHGIGTIWNYKPPRSNHHTVKRIPYPDQLHKMIHLDYKKDPVVNAMIKTILVCNYFIGWRFPSEAWASKTSHIDLDRKEMLVVSPKFDFAERLVDIQEITNRRNICNLRNWIKIWRPRLVWDTKISKDYLFLKPTGEPFGNEEQLRMFIERNAKPKIRQIFHSYYNYSARHWNATSRLIRSKIKTRKYDTFDVMNQMGHDKENTTKNYCKDADYYYRKVKCDWIKRVLKYHKKKVEENTLKHSKNAITKKNPCCVWKPSERAVRRLPMVNTLTEGKNIAITPFLDGCKFLTYLFKSFLFSLYITFKNSCHPTKNNNQPDRRWTI